jgi:hypothetical protein
MDGRNPCPVNHGVCKDLLTDAVQVVQTYMDLAPGEVNFTLMALAGSE